ncbi:MAG: hypothetical protein WCK80_02290 [bacterium]|jgi:hypothetical protein
MLGVTRLKSLLIAGIFLAAVGTSSLATPTVKAAGQFPDQQVNGSIGIQGTITKGAPTQAATITTPGNGAVFTTVPITVNGTCPANTIVKLFSNNVFVGSVFCNNGSYSLQINLFSGRNDLIARVYDALDQAGPDSNTVSVTFNDAQFAEFGTRVQISSIYAVRGAPPGQQLTWPFTLTGGVGPYAVSIDWGDGSPTDLISRQLAGDFTANHTYKVAGIYRVLVKATDKNGTTAFLQVIGQATGATQNVNGGNASATVRKEVLWVPMLAMIPLIVAAFWAGRRNELFSIRKQLEKTRNEDNK